MVPADRCSLGIAAGLALGLWRDAVSRRQRRVRAAVSAENVVKRLMEEKTRLEQSVLGLELQVRRSEDPEVQRRVDAIVPYLEEEMAARRRGDTAVHLEAIMRNVAMHVFDAPMARLVGLNFKQLNGVQRHSRGRARRDKGADDVVPATPTLRGTSPWCGLVCTCGTTVFANAGAEVVSEADAITAAGEWAPDPTAQPFVPLEQLHEQTMRLGMQGRQRHQPFVKRRRLCHAVAAVDAKASSAMGPLTGMAALPTVAAVACCAEGPLRGMTALPTGAAAARVGRRWRRAVLDKEVVFMQGVEAHIAAQTAQEAQNVDWLLRDLGAAICAAGPAEASASSR
ncbi:unnamed protein product [Prorocentrum cordatum]|uniref:Uncharacterized protein n=1 Tax=Prorocentrum cordatum TaxID=2364126 RepID=A0ABN9S386_9DINO|nr:unnamed protein product [Polarella glacialis]